MYFMRGNIFVYIFPLNGSICQYKSSLQLEINNDNGVLSGMFSLRKKIEDVVLRAETLAPAALELEEAIHIKHEEMIRQSNLWDDLAKSNEVLIKLANSSRVVDDLKSLRYKVMFYAYHFCWNLTSFG